MRSIRDHKDLGEDVVRVAVASWLVHLEWHPLVFVCNQLHLVLIVRQFA